MPVAGGNITSGGKGFQLLIAFAHDFGRQVSPEIILLYAGTDLLVCADIGAQGFLYEDSSVKAFWRVLADVAIAAVMVCYFSKITLQYAAAADVGFGVLLHALQFLQVDILLSALGSEFGKQNQVCKRVEQ